MAPKGPVSSPVEDVLHDAVEDDDDPGRRRRNRAVAPNDVTFPNNVLAVANPTTDPILAEHLRRTNEALASNKSTEDREHKKKKTSGPLPDPYEQTRNINKVTLEIPLMIQYPSNLQPSVSANSKKQRRQLNENQDASQQAATAMPKWKTLSQNARCSMHCFVPPSTPNGRWTGSISGSTSVFQTAGTATGSSDVTYKVSSYCRLMAGCDFITLADSRPMQLHCGAILKSPQHKSTFQVSLRQRPKNKWDASLVARKVFDPWILASSFGWNKSDVKAMLTMSSMTTHVLKFGFGWTIVSSSSLMQVPIIQLMIDPRLSSYRRLPLSFQYQPADKTWSATATFHTSRPTQTQKANKSSSSVTHGPTSSPASWRVGIQGGAALQFRWSILVAYQHGDITVRIPIILGTAATLFRRQQTQLQQNTNDSKHQNTLVATIIPFIAIAVIGMANEMLARILWRSNDDSAAALSKPTTDAAAIRGEPKDKKDAATQQRLMRRQAESRTAAELEKNGLVIQSAIYEFGDTESWDVTIPLQFWVQNGTSTLRLAEGSKRHLLGFYPLTSSMDLEADDGTKEAKTEENRVPWWQEYWTPTTRRSKLAASSQVKYPASKPKLIVRYSFEGNDFEKEVSDEEALDLPHPDDIDKLKERKAVD